MVLEMKTYVLILFIFNGVPTVPVIAEFTSLKNCENGASYITRVLAENPYDRIKYTCVEK